MTAPRDLWVAVNYNSDRAPFASRVCETYTDAVYCCRASGSTSAVAVPWPLSEAVRVDLEAIHGAPLPDPEAF